MNVLIVPDFGVRHGRRGGGFCLCGRRRRGGGDGGRRALRSFRLGDRMNHITIRILHRIAVGIGLDVVIICGARLYIGGGKDRILHFRRRGGRGGRGDGLGYAAIRIGCGR